MSEPLDELMNATTTTSPIVEVVSVSCSKCDFTADIPDDDRPATTTRGNLHDNTWEHVGCGGQISFATRPERPLTLDHLDRLMTELKAEIPYRSGFTSEVVDQLRVHYPEEIRKAVGIVREALALSSAGSSHNASSGPVEPAEPS